MKIFITVFLLQISLANVTNNDKKTKDKKKRKLPEGDIIESLYHRAYSINDKIDHLLFHHNHDLTGKKAQFTPFGIHFLPRYKGADSVDQKLKMVDYMHSMGGFHPQGGFMTPYLFAHQIEEEKQHQHEQEHQAASDEQNEASGEAEKNESDEGRLLL